MREGISHEQENKTSKGHDDESAESGSQDRNCIV